MKFLASVLIAAIILPMLIETGSANLLPPSGGGSSSPAVFQLSAGAFSTTGEKLKGLSGIYAIIHRETGMVYVGSSVNVWVRLRAHIGDARRGTVNTPLYRAIRKYGADAFDFEVLERCDKSQLVSREDFWIRFYNAASVAGFNVKKSAVENHGFSISESTRARLSISSRNSSPETRARISAANKGRKFTAEHRAKMSAANSGKKRTPETCAKISLARKGKKLSLQHRQNIGAGVRGKKRAHEANLKMLATRRANAIARLQEGTPILL